MHGTRHGKCDRRRPPSEESEDLSLLSTLEKTVSKTFSDRDLSRVDVVVNRAELVSLKVDRHQ